MDSSFSSRVLVRSLLAGALLGGAFVCWYWSGRDGETSTAAGPSPKSTPAGTVSPPAPHSLPAQRPEASASAILPVNVDSAIGRCCDLLRGSASPEQNLVALQALAAELRKMDRATVVASLMRFLDGGRDAPTGLGFSVLSGGALGASPSLRVALLDLLGELDRAAAAAYADVIFQRSQVPDEWAVALRDKGRHLGPAAAKTSPSYENRILQLLTRQEWLQAPTAGFLHAFDAAVYVGGDRPTSNLMHLMNAVSHPAVRHAARLALDRLTVEHYTPVATKLAAATALQTMPAARAQLMSRASLFDAEQVRLVEQYLRNDKVTDAEAAEFFSVFPNANLELTNSLLTKNPFLRMDVMAEQDKAALALARAWKVAGSVGHAALLDQAILRLEDYVASAERGRVDSANATPAQGGAR